MRPNRVGVDLVRNTGRTIKLKTELFERSYNWHRACQTTLLLRDSLSLSRSFLLWLQPWSLSTIMLLWHSFLIIIIIKFGFSWTWCARATKSEAIRRSQLVGFSAASRQMLQICFKTPITSLESQKFSYVVGIRDRSVTRMSINPI